MKKLMMILMMGVGLMSCQKEEVEVYKQAPQAECYYGSVWNIENSAVLVRNLCSENDTVVNINDVMYPIDTVDIQIGSVVRLENKW